MSRLVAISALLTAGTGVMASPLRVERRTSEITSVPQYVLDYAPIVYLHSEELYQPSDLAAQLANTYPVVNVSTPIDGAPSPLTLDNLDQLNALGGSEVYLNTIEDFTTDPSPSFLFGVKPDANGQTQGAVSSQVVLHDKGEGTVDAYYFYFYAYNQGDKVLDEGLYLGDHVGDVEHNMIRFENGEPSQIWYSQHANGAAYTYDAVTKTVQRPLAYSGNGTHASWATAGTHDHTIPNVVLPEGPLVDYTDNGTLWDPVLSAYFYTVDFANNTNGDDSDPTFAALTNPYDASQVTPVNWLYFVGQYGDDTLPQDDPRQRSIFNISETDEYTAGPNGPRFKGLNRVAVCPGDADDCNVQIFLLPGA